MINNEKMIGIKFSPDKLIQGLIKGLPNPKWSQSYNMAYIANTKGNLGIIFNTFKGLAWINYNKFLTNRPVNTNNESVDVEWFRKRKPIPEYRLCPEEYLLKLELRRYANNTVRTYVSFFEMFINHYKHKELNAINESDIRAFLQKLIHRNVSNSYLNQAINAIKFYYEVVLGMPNRFYEIERPRKESKLPKVISKEEIIEMKACVKCHTPLGFRSYSISSPGDDYDKLAQLPAQGIFCNWCHNINEVKHIGDAGYELAPGGGEDDPSTMLGPRKDATSDFHPTKYSELHTKSEFCGLCHNVSHTANKLPIEQTYNEWKNSPYNTGNPETV